MARHLLTKPRNTPRPQRHRLQPCNRCHRRRRFKRTEKAEGGVLKIHMIKELQEKREIMDAKKEMSEDDFREGHLEVRLLRADGRRSYPSYQSTLSLIWVSHADII